MNKLFSKRQRAILRDLVRKAHEREMHKLLSPIAEDFDAWRSGKKDLWDVVDKLDGYSKARKSTSGSYRDPGLAHFMVARAVVEGLLQEAEVPAEMLTLLAGPISFYRESQAEDSSASEELDA